MSTPITEERTKERIKSSNEVFTPESSVEEILNDIEKYKPELFTNWSKTILEPTCGNGRFLVGILKKRLEYMEQNCTGSPQESFRPLGALRQIYAIDIHPSNIVEARNALIDSIKEHAKKYDTGKERYWRGKRTIESINKILEKNIVCGDSAKILGDERYHQNYDFDIIQSDPYEFKMDEEIKKIEGFKDKEDIKTETDYSALVF